MQPNSIFHFSHYNALMYVFKEKFKTISYLVPYFYMLFTSIPRAYSFPQALPNKWFRSSLTSHRYYRICKTSCTYGVTSEPRNSFPKHCLNTCMYIYVPLIHVDKHKIIPHFYNINLRFLFFLSSSFSSFLVLKSRMTKASFSDIPCVEVPSCTWNFQITTRKF